MPKYLNVDSNRKFYTTNTIKILNEINHLGQYTIEIVTIDPTNGTKIKQYKLYKNQLDSLLEKHKNSTNPSNIEYVNNINNNSYSNIAENIVNNEYTQYSHHPEYSNNNNPLHLNSYQHTINIKNTDSIPKTLMDSNIDGYDNLSSSFSSFIPEKKNTNSCDKIGS